MPVNIWQASIACRITAHLHQQPDAKESVRLIGEIMIEGLFEDAHIPSAPVTIFANLLGFAHIADRCFNRPMVIAGEHPFELMDTIDLSFHVRFSSFANVTFHAIYLRMRRRLVSGELRLHWHVTNLPAELD